MQLTQAPKREAHPTWQAARCPHEMINKPDSACKTVLSLHDSARAQLFLHPHSTSCVFCAQIDHMEAKEVPQEEMMHRIKRCEDSLSSINHEKLSPFHQQEILNRIENLEAQVCLIPATLLSRTWPCLVVCCANFWHRFDSPQAGTNIFLRDQTRVF